MCKKLVAIQELYSLTNGKIISHVYYYLKFERSLASVFKTAS